MAFATRIIVLGSSNTDLVVNCERLPKPGETLLGGEFHRYPGGKGANQAVAAARAGARVTLIGARGDDEFGRTALAGLRAEKIVTRYFQKTSAAPSGVALILVGGKTRENVIAVAKSANDTVSAASVRAAQPEFAKAQAVVAQLEVPLVAVMEAARQARRARIPFLLNPAPARELPPALLRLVDTLTPNEHEAAFLTGHDAPETAARCLLKMGCRRVVVTLGARGALLVDKNGIRHFRARRVRAVDTVGAGDCFMGWLAAGLAEGSTADEAIPRALAAATISVTRAGAQPSFPWRNEVYGL